MMSAAMMAMAAFLLANLVVGLLRAYQGPTLADRMLAMLLFGTTTVGAILLLAYAQDMAALVAVALVFVMLATVVSFTFVQMQGGIRPHRQEDVHPHRQEGVHPHRQEGVHPHRQEGAHPHRQEGVHPHRQEGVHPHRQEGVHPHGQEGVHPHGQEGE